MATKVRSPFDGKPRTTETKDEAGRSSYTVALRALTPLRAEIADKISLLTSVVVGFGGVWFSFHLETPNIYEVGALLGSPLPAYWVARLSLYCIMQKTKRVVFTPEHFIIENLVRDKTFDRNLPYGFALYNHDRAEREEEVASFREGKRTGWWWLRPPKRYLGSSYHLSFQYLDQRNIIMTVYRYKHAQRLLARLNAIKRVLETEAKGIEEVSSPARDWMDQPGELPGPVTGG